MELPRLTEPIRMDGIVDDDEWAGAAHLTGVMHLPDFGAEPSERTLFFVAYDSEYLYFACRAYDSEPDQVRVTTLARDALLKFDLTLSLPHCPVFGVHRPS